MVEYVITGVDRSGKRFSPIVTKTPHHYNIWRGSLWKVLGKSLNGKKLRQLVKRYY